MRDTTTVVGLAVSDSVLGPGTVCRPVSEHSGRESWWRRAFAFLRANRDQLVVDAIIIFTWIVVSAALFRELSLPRWLHYLVLFVGVVIYSRLTPNWERSARPVD